MVFNEKDAVKAQAFRLDDEIDEFSVALAVRRFVAALRHGAAE